MYELDDQNMLENSCMLSDEEKTIDNQLLVLEPNNPVAVRFQNTLKQHLLKQKENIKRELLTQNDIVRSKQNEKSSLTNDIKNATCRVDAQHSLLGEFNRMKLELEAAKEQVETYINQGKRRSTEISTKTSTETNNFTVLKRKLDDSTGLLNGLIKYEKEQEVTFNICNQQKSQAKQYKKKLLNEQQKQDLLLSSLTQEVVRLEDHMKQLGVQAETKYNERELLKQNVMDISTDLDVINGDNTKITLLWNDVLINIHKRDNSIRMIKNDFQKAKNQYQTLLMEANSYDRSAQEEFQKNYDLITLANKLKVEQNNLQNSFKISLEKFQTLKNEYFKFVQMTEYQNKNLDQVLFEQRTIQNEINTLLHLLNKKSNEKLKYEEDSLDELKKQLFANNYAIQINNKISEMKVQNKEHELILVGIENNLSQALLKLEQYRSTSSNKEKDLENNTKYLNDQGITLSALDSELKKICTEIKSKSRQIDLEDQHLETMKKRLEDGTSITPQIQIDQIKHKVNDVEKDIDFIKQSWVQKQNENVKLLDQRNTQFTELNKIRKYVSIMDTRNIKLELEIVSLTKESDQYKRTYANMRNTIFKLNENLSQNKGMSSQLLNENEWTQHFYLAEMKGNDKQCLEYMDQLKLLKHELTDMKNVYIEKQRESKSWDTKVQVLAEMKNEMKKKEGDSGDIVVLQKEIHRMRVRESQLKKNLEKIMFDLDACIIRRETIYNKVADRDVRLKMKNKVKQQFLKKLIDLRLKIKQIKMECKKLDGNISDLMHGQMELESKITYTNDKLNKIHKTVNDLIKKIEDIGAIKIKNIYAISYKQNHAQLLDEVKKGKYQLLIKNESKINEEFAAERKKTSDLICVTEALKSDFPHLDLQITRLLNMLGSIEN